MELWTWLRGREGAEWLARHYADNMQGLGGETRAMMRQMYAAETAKLENADPIYVSAEMCELIDAARASFEPEPLLRTDLLTDDGFVYFAAPFDVLDRFERPVTIKGFAWLPIISTKQEQEVMGAVTGTGKRGNPEISDDAYRSALDKWRGGHGYTGDGIALTVYADSQREFAFAKAFDPEIQRAELDLDKHFARRKLPKVIPMHLTPWWFGMDFGGNEWDEIGQPTGAAWWWRIVQTTLRLMQQRIAVRHEERLDRPLRREAKRLAYPERQVVVVRLRRERSETHEPYGEANYSHRFIVGGHWRWQWYPTLEGHRQIWISPYVKGPSDKPLVIKPRRAYTWDR
jgi:hypothetical protein